MCTWSQEHTFEKSIFSGAAWSRVKKRDWIIIDLNLRLAHGPKTYLLITIIPLPWGIVSHDSLAMTTSRGRRAVDTLVRWWQTDWYSYSWWLIKQTWLRIVLCSGQAYWNGYAHACRSRWWIRRHWWSWNWICCLLDYNFSAIPAKAR